MANKQTRLVDLAPVDEDSYVRYNPSNFINTKMILNNYNWEPGKYGNQYAEMHCTVVATGKNVIITSGAKPIVDSLAQLNEGVELDLEFSFKQVGKTIFFA